jgi:putative glutamine amidotransferase
MPRPLIGLTMDVGAKPENYSLHSGYTTSVEKAGGMPFGIPYRTDISLIPDILDRLDGILFTGGDDLDPALYGQEWHPKAIKLDAARQHFEMALIAEVERRRLPTLGICLGSQLLNVHRGGSMHQFLPDVPRTNAIEHRKLERDLPRHALQIEPKSTIAQAIGKTEINGNTYHKQAADRLGRGLRVVATAPDGVIEGFEDPTYPLMIGVQWHPERLHNEPEHLAIFKLLVAKAAGIKR